MKQITCAEAQIEILSLGILPDFVVGFEYEWYHLYVLSRVMLHFLILTVAQHYFVTKLVI